MGTGDRSRALTTRVNNLTTSRDEDRRRKDRPAVTRSCFAPSPSTLPLDPHGDTPCRGLGRAGAFAGPRERAAWKVSGKKKCFNGGEVETSVWFWLQPPHFSYEEANSEGTPARARGS